MWPSWLRRQIVALKIVGSSPIIHPIKTGDIFGYLLFLYGIWGMMGVERAKRKQSGGLFSARGRVPALSDASGTDVDESATTGNVAKCL